MGFLNPKSKYDGTCKANPEHTWKIGDPVYMHNKAPRDAPAIWVFCSNIDCFKGQGGTVEEKPTGGGKYPAKTRTMDESMAFLKAFDDLAWKMARDKSIELFPDTLREGLTPQAFSALMKERAIATESIFHTLVEAYNGK